MRSARCIIFLLVSLVSCLPKPPAYPHRDFAAVTREAQAISDRLEAHVRQWLAGKAPAQIPAELLPKGLNTQQFKGFYLQRFEEIDPKKQWLVRPDKPIDFRSLRGSFPDPHATYLLQPVVFAPFGSRLMMEGEFPHCRFFDAQITPSFDPREYLYDKYAGKGEVGIVDADMEPLPGHSNPFLVGAKRNAAKRSYQLTFEMAIGDPTKLNPSHKAPHYRGKGNVRYGSGIQYQGPWGEPKSKGHGRGVWDTGELWIRYYAIDKGKDSLGGVPLPKLYYQLASGEKFYINYDVAHAYRELEKTMPARNMKPAEPAKYHGATIGWAKQFDIFLVIAQGLSIALYREKPKHKAYVRDLHLGVTGRGEDQPPPANYEVHATGCTYINYLVRGMSVGKGKVAVLTGKLPTYPKTRNGEPVMERAECRYWSITSYDSSFPFAKVPGCAMTSVMDDEVVTDADGRYVIVYSRREDRPRNARPENGVTWLEWGDIPTQSFTFRWMSVAPEWNMPIAPNEENLPWTKTSWSGKNLDRKLIYENNHNGFLGWYLPQMHYLTREDFETLGGKVKADQVPVWK